MITSLQIFSQTKVQFLMYLTQELSKKLNISFTKLGEEECEVCSVHDMHKKDLPECLDCEICKKIGEHQRKFREARESYCKDKASKSMAYAVDLQKVVVLPIMDQFKTAIFTPRLVTFNETFAHLGGATAVNPNITALWHEATSGQNAPDIASAFWNFFIQVNCSLPIVLWLDNCSAQNKNWTFFTMLVQAIHFFNFESITLKFFEPGHTFMAADSVHAAIEKQMKKKKSIWDFQDFANVVATSNIVKIQIVPLAHSDFLNFQDGTATKNLKLRGRPKLAEMSMVQFRKYSRQLFYSKSHDESKFKPFSFLRPQFSLALPSKKTHSRGIPEQKKSKICNNLLQHIPALHRLFWKELPVNNQSNDLLTHNDVEHVEN
jgi:hypothetical protein